MPDRATANPIGLDRVIHLDASTQRCRQGENDLKMSNTCKNVFEAILRYGHDEDFVPNDDHHFQPTDAPAGSPEKIEVLRRRVELGQPLWHTTDRIDYSGLTGAIRPRE